MAHPLERARLKLDRAKEHLGAFDQESGDWLRDTNFCRFDFQDYGDERWYFADITATPPPRLSAILVDCVQNIRASLDYLVWELVIANRHTPNEETSFPIYLTPPKAGRQFNPKCLTGVDPAAVAIIEQLQPYYGGKNPDTDLLLFVRELSNTDKHRTINVVIGQVVVSEFRIFFDFSGRQVIVPPAWREAGVLHHGANVAMYARSALQGGEYMKVEADAIGFVTLGQALPWGSQPVSSLLGRSLAYIADEVFPRFSNFF